MAPIDRKTTWDVIVDLTIYGKASFNPKQLSFDAIRMGYYREVRRTNQAGMFNLVEKHKLVRTKLRDDLHTIEVSQPKFTLTIDIQEEE